MIEEFHKWFCDKLRIPDSAEIFPTENLTGDRPDFIIKSGQNILGYIEVELGDENKFQLVNYRNKYEDEKRKVFSITGKKLHSSDLGLDEVKSFFLYNLKSYINNQTKLSVEYLIKLIDTYTNERTSFSRKPVSDEVLKKPFIKQLLKTLACYIPKVNTSRSIPGYIYYDTIKDKGFSLRVYSTESKSKSVALFSISNGRESIIFQSASKYRNYLSHKKSEDVEKWIDFITQKLKLPIKKKGCEIPINVITPYLNELADIIKMLV